MSDQGQRDEFTITNQVYPLKMIDAVVNIHNFKPRVRTHQIRGAHSLFLM